jgi:chemotaxis protein methyltransferase CheR
MCRALYRISHTNTLTMTDKEFEQFRTLVYRGTNIFCPHSQKPLFERKLRSRLAVLRLDSFQEYYALLTAPDSGEEEFLHLIDVIAIHETSFFRIFGHFQGLETHVFPDLLRCSHGPIRVWSAGCSTGEEAYSIAMTFLETWQRFQMSTLPSEALHILATDVNPKMIDIARKGLYASQKVQKIPQAFLDKYLEYRDDQYTVNACIRKLVTFDVFNLIDIETPPAVHFDVIFCRNVLIYFDRPAQLRLITELTHLLNQGGYLFLGDAESLHTFHHVAGNFDILESGNAIMYQKRGVQTS